MDAAVDAMLGQHLADLGYQAGGISGGAAGGVGGDGTVPFEGSGARTHEAILGSQLHVIAGAPHGCNVSHADEFNRVLLEFLAR